MTPHDLPDEWRERAAQARRWSADGAACAFEECAAELTKALSEWHEEPLTLQDAAEESGYSVDHLRRLVNDGCIPNAGERSVKIRRGNLPRKPGHALAVQHTRLDGAISSRVQMARSVVESN